MGLTEEAKAELKKTITATFNEFDADGSGAIDADELKQGRGLRPTHTPSSNPHQLGEWGGAHFLSLRLSTRVATGAGDSLL